MKASRAPSPGESRACPHCQATILQSATFCPICRHSLKLTSFEAPRARPATCPFLVEGTLEHPGASAPWEYSIIDGSAGRAGKLLSRQTVGVGALRQGQQRIFSLRVEMFAASA
jgi:hypothetical protein